MLISLGVLRMLKEVKKNCSSLSLSKVQKCVYTCSYVSVKTHWHTFNILQNPIRNGCSNYCSCISYLGYAAIAVYHLCLLQVISAREINGK